MFIVALVLAVIWGWLKGGSIVRLAHLPLRFALLLPIPFVIRALLLQPKASDVPWLVDWAPALQGVAYLLLTGLAVLNRHLPGSGYLIAGTSANALVIMANGGRMPVSEWAIQVAAQGAEQVVALTALRADKSLTHELLGSDARLPWLADIIPLPRPFPFPSVASVGDVAIAVGLVCLIISAMGTRSSSSRAGKGSSAPAMSRTAIRPQDGDPSEQ